MKNKHRKKTLAVAPPNVVFENRKAKKVDAGLDPFSTEARIGKPSYVFKSQQSGDVKKIAATIKSYRRENPDCTYKNMYKVLYDRYPWIFEIEPEKMPSSNISHIINSYDLWKRAYHVNCAEIIELAELDIAERLESGNEQFKDVIHAYDVLKKYEFARKQLEIEQNNLAVSDNSITFTFGGGSSE